MATENKKLAKLIALFPSVTLTAQGKVTEWPRPFIRPDAVLLKRGSRIKVNIIELK